MIFAGKINKMPKFYMIFALKCQNFTIIARKIFFFRFFFGGVGGARAPVSYAYVAKLKASSVLVADIL